jgi:hypothetical protein
VTDQTVNIIRGLFSSANLPELQTLELMIVWELFTSTAHSTNLHRFRPFSSSTDQMDKPIFPNAISERVCEIRILLDSRYYCVHRPGDLCKLLGTQHRPGILKVFARSEGYGRVEDELLYQL